MVEQVLSVKGQVELGSTERADLVHVRTEWVGRGGALREKSITLDCALEEYCRRKEAGEAIDPVEFARHYSRYQKSIQLLLEVHEVISHDPAILEQSTVADWPEIGSAYLGYELLDELGRGTFARVYLAAETNLAERLVAVKVADDDCNEAELIARLGGHDNIVPIYSVHRDAAAGRTLICMPYVGRATLCDLLDIVIEHGVPKTATEALTAIVNADDRFGGPQAGEVRPLPAGSYLDYVRQLGIELASALDHTHRRGVCHGDLKPSNILLVRGGQPMLVDFNLSLEMGDVSRLGGTLPYIAPEQLQALVDLREGRPAQPLDARCDLFSLGAILYELLTGQLPFGFPKPNAPVTELAAELLDKRRAGVRPIRELNPLVDRHTAMAIERCLQFEPAARWQSASELAQQLRRATKPLPRAMAWADNHRRTVVALVTAVIVGITAAAAWQANRPSLAERNYRAALQHYQNQDYDEAISLATSALDLDSQNPEPRFLLGRIRLAKGLYPEAATDFATADELRPSGEAAACRAYCLSMMKEHREAIAVGERALELKPSLSARVDCNVAHSCRRLGRLDEAIYWATSAIAKDDLLQSAFFTRAIAIRTKAMSDETVQLEQAASDIRRAIELGPKTADLFMEAAYIEEARARRDSNYVSIADMYLLDAIKYGMPRHVIERHPWFKGRDLSHEAKAVYQRQAPQFLSDPLQAGA